VSQELPSRPRDVPKASLKQTEPIAPLFGAPAALTPAQVLTRAGALTEPETVTTKQFEIMLAGLVGGAKVEAILEHVGLTKADVEAYLRADSKRYDAWRNAFLAGLRRGWSIELFDDILDNIAGGMSVQAACEKHGRNKIDFVRITRRDPVLKAMYDEAREIAAECEGDDLRGISDDDSQDVLDDGKGGQRGNTAAVARDKLRIETRLRLMTSYNRDRFAENIPPPPSQTNVVVNVSHADRLESARSRLRAIREAPATEGEFTDIPAAKPADDEDLSWLDT
jgi:hypothetical protein